MFLCVDYCLIYMRILVFVIFLNVLFFKERVIKGGCIEKESIELVFGKWGDLSKCFS